MPGLHLAPPELFRPSVEREALVRRVEGRWTRRLTAVVAGAGFGKTTLLTHAFAAGEDRGVQRWVSVTSSTATADSLARLLLQSLGAEPEEARAQAPADELARQVAEAAWGLAPDQLAIVIDDCHRLGPDGATFLRALVDQLPATAHLLCAGRRDVVSTAAGVASGEEEVLVEDDLRFEEDDLRRFAAMREVPLEQVQGSEGWPVLAELCASAPAGATNAYLWDEVLADIDPADAMGLALLALAGPADQAMVDELTTESPGVRQLIAELPMVRIEGGAVRLHDLWREPLLARAGMPSEAAVRQRAADALMGRGRFADAFDVLADGHLWEDALAAARAALLSSHGTPHPGQASLWLSGLPAALLHHHTALLLHAVVARGQTPDLAMSALVEAADASTAAGDIDAAVCALTLLGTVAFARQDRALGIDVVLRASALATTGNAGAGHLVSLAGVLMRVVAGQNDGALVDIQALPAPEPYLVGLWRFLHARVLCECGRHAEAEVVLDNHRRLMAPFRMGVAILDARTRWARDDVAGARAGLAADLEQARADRRHHDAETIEAFLALGLAVDDEEDTSDDVPADPAAGPPPPDPTSFAATLAVLREAVLVLPRDRDRARALLESAVRAAGIGAMIPELRYLVPMAGLADPVEEPSGPSGDGFRLGVALAARRADPEAVIEWPAVERAYPLLSPATVADLTAWWFVDHAELPAWHRRAGPRVRRALLLLSGDEGPVAEGAARALSSLPMLPTGSVVIRLLGPVEVRHGAHGDPTPVTRERVRALLALLVCHASIPRSRAAALLWPDLDDKAAANNLRTTLSYLVRTLEPERSRDAPPYFVDQDGGQLALRRSARLVVDGEAMVEQFDRADRCRALGRTREELTSLLDGLARWRGEPGTDVVHDGWADPTFDHWIGRYTSASVRAAELLVESDPRRAAELARSVLVHDPWSLAAFGVITRGALAVGGPSDARVALDRYAAVAGELGLDLAVTDHPQLARELSEAAVRR